MSRKWTPQTRYMLWRLGIIWQVGYNEEFGFWRNLHNLKVRCNFEQEIMQNV